MRKRVKMMVAAAVCAVTMFVVGCGGTGSQTASDAPAAVEAAASADPSEKYVGEWKLAYIESDGVTIAGDMSGLQQLAGQDMSVVMTLANEGTGSIALGANKGDITWELVDDDNIKVNLPKDFSSEEADEAPVLDATYSDGELRLDMSDSSEDAGTDEGGLAEDVSEGIMVLTPDGKSDITQLVDIAETSAVTSKDDLVGEWKLCGIGIFGLYLYGDSDSIDNIFGDESATISFSSDDTCKFFDSDGTYEVGKDGAVLSGEEIGEEIPVVTFGDKVVIDMSAFYGQLFGSDLPLFMVYSK